MCKILALSRNHCYTGKAKCATYSECVFLALVIQHAMRMRRIVIWAPLYHIFPTLSRKRHDFRKKIFTEHKIYSVTVVIPVCFIT